MKTRNPQAPRNPHERDGFRTGSITRFHAIPDCVAVRIGESQVDLRDTKDANSPTLSFTPSEWDAFVQSVKLGEFDR